MTGVDARTFMLVEGADDHVELRLLAEHVGDLLRTRNPEIIRERSMAVLRDLLTSELMIAGTLDLQTGQLRKWPGTAEEVLDRIEREWHEHGRPVGLYEIVCFQNTPRGQKLGRRLKSKLGLP